MRMLLCLGIVSLAATAAHAAVIGKATVTAEQAPVMSGKQVLATAKKGDTFDVTELKGDWFGVAPSQGWIHKSNVRYEPAAPGPVMSTGPLAPAACAEIDRLIDKAIFRMLETSGGRKFAGIFAFEGPVARITVPYLRDLPETLSLAGPGGTCQATLGWQWLLKEERPHKLSLRPVQVGAMLRLDGTLALGGTTLPAGTLLFRTATGWEAVSASDGVARLRAHLEAPAPTKEAAEQLRELGTLGAAVLGPAGQSLFQPLAKAAVDGGSPFISACCARALERIGDKRAIDVLREARTKVQDDKWEADDIDASIKALQGQPAAPQSPAP